MSGPRPITMQEFMAVQQKILACAIDPRGSTITAFTVRETAAFTGLAIPTIYNYLAWQHASSIKMPAFGRVNARVVPMDAFVKIARKTGKHRILSKHVKQTRVVTGAVVDFLFEQLY